VRGWFIFTHTLFSDVFMHLIAVSFLNFLDLKVLFLFVTFPFSTRVIFWFNQARSSASCLFF